MSTESANKGYEVRDVRVRFIVFWTAVLTTLVVASYFIVGGMNRALRVERGPLSPLFTRPEPAEPKLQANPLEDLRQHRAYERSMVESYKWIQPDQVARVPVTRAMEILLQRGLPVRGRVKPSGPQTGGGI